MGRGEPIRTTGEKAWHSVYSVAWYVVLLIQYLYKQDDQSGGFQHGVRLNNWKLIWGSPTKFQANKKRQQAIQVSVIGSARELINHIDTKSKCRHVKKFTCKGTLRQMFICLRPPPLLWPHTPLLHTIHCIHYSLYSIRIHTEKGKRGS